MHAHSRPCACTTTARAHARTRARTHAHAHTRVAHALAHSHSHTHTYERAHTQSPTHTLGLTPAGTIARTFWRTGRYLTGHATKLCSLRWVLTLGPSGTRVPTTQPCLHARWTAASSLATSRRRGRKSPCRLNRLPLARLRRTAAYRMRCKPRPRPRHALWVGVRARRSLGRLRRCMHACTARHSTPRHVVHAARCIAATSCASAAGLRAKAARTGAVSGRAGGLRSANRATSSSRTSCARRCRRRSRSRGASSSLFSFFALRTGPSVGVLRRRAPVGVLRLSLPSG